MYRITKYIYIYTYLKFIYSNENKINKKSFFIIVLFRIYLIEKMIFKFLKVIHGFFMVENIFKIFKIFNSNIYYKNIFY